MIGYGFSMSRTHAEALADAVAVGVNGQPTAQALRRDERAWLDTVSYVGPVRNGKPLIRRPGGLNPDTEAPPRGWTLFARMT